MAMKALNLVHPTRHGKHREGYERTKPGIRREGYWKGYNKTRDDSKFGRANFIAWDGEGIEDGEPFEYKGATIQRQKYALLANSLDDHIINIDGLSTLECLRFLTSDAYPKNAIHVGFGLDYDINMMLKDMPLERLLQLRKGDKYIRYHNFRLMYRPRKCLYIMRMPNDYRLRRNAKMKPVRSIVLWDTFGFFQSRFVKVVETWTKGTEYEERYRDIIADIQKGKERRGSFTIEELETFVLPYCLHEVHALRDIMHILHGYVKEAGLRLGRWDGAGAVAASLLKREGVKNHIKSASGDELQPPEVTEAGEYAYFGGRIEAIKIGNFTPAMRYWDLADMEIGKYLPKGVRYLPGKIFHDDLCSAYPSAMPRLYSLAHGEWEHLTKPMPLQAMMPFLQTCPMYLARISWSGLDPYSITPFMWRAPNDTVLVPTSGMGWQWSPELEVAARRFPNARMIVHEAWLFWPNGKYLPFEFVPAMYLLRKQLKELGRGIEKVYKLGLNSLYGKMVQALGYQPGRRIKPPYHNILYGGFITSLTRARLLDAAMNDPDGVISFATDGIYSLSDLKLDRGTNLGQWEYHEHEVMTIVQSGFYWYITNGKEQAYYRGFDKDVVTRQMVIDKWKAGEPDLTVPITRFTTLGAAAGLNDYDVWRTWRKIPRKLNITAGSATKRITLEPTIVGDDIMFPTMVKGLPPGHELMMSTKYKFRWDDDTEGVFQPIDGQSNREVAEEMYHMEISPMDD